MFSMIINIYNKKTKGPTLMELFTATGKLSFFFDNYRCSTCAPRVTGHTSIRYSSSCPTRANMVASIFFTATVIRAFRSARSRGNGGTNTRSLTYSKRKKITERNGRGHRGHSIRGWSFPDARPIQRPGNTVFRYWQTSQWNAYAKPSILLFSTSIAP